MYLLISLLDITNVHVPIVPVGEILLTTKTAVLLWVYRPAGGAGVFFFFFFSLP